MDQPAVRDPHLKDRITLRHDTPMQRKMRRLAPMPIGCVFIPWRDDDEITIRNQLKAIKTAGFTCLKQTFGNQRFTMQQVMHMALDEGLIPYWYAEGGWEDLTPELLAKLGLPPELDIDEAMRHPAVIAHQTTVLRRRIDRTDERQHIATTAAHSEKKKGQKLPVWMVPSVVVAPRGHELDEEMAPAFLTWLQRTHGTPEAVARVWNLGRIELGETRDAPGWDWVKAQIEAGRPKDYGYLRDVMRFKAERKAGERMRQAIRLRDAFDREEPIRGGGETGLFLPMAAHGVDMEAIATAMAEGGSFYPSMHPTWHLEEVDFELARPTYMQAGLAADWAKGVWSAPWESSGGPQWFSGGKAPFVPEVRGKFPGCAIDEGGITTLMLSYLAAGFRGVGMWTWDPREAGWEAGEYALTDRNRQPTERAHTAGAIGQAMVRLRREIWSMTKEPLVGVLHDWNNDAIWAAMAITGREMYREQAMRARVGCERALIDANVPYEHVTVRDLDEGLAPRYRAIVLPGFISLSAKVLSHLTAFVRAGGRVLMDLPGAHYDEDGRLLQTAAGTAFERLFGAVFHEFAFANPYGFADAIRGVACGGFQAELTPTTGAAVATYDRTGKPAIIEHRLGAGSAVFLGTQASLDCFRPGNRPVQDLFVRQILGDLVAPYRCAECMVHRMAAPAADHYFFINDGDAVTARLNTDWEYREATDAVTGEILNLSALAVPARSGRWVRCVKG